MDVKMIEDEQVYYIRCSIDEFIEATNVLINDDQQIMEARIEIDLHENNHDIKLCVVYIHKIYDDWSNPKEVDYYDLVSSTFIIWPEGCITHIDPNHISRYIDKLHDNIIDNLNNYEWRKNVSEAYRYDSRKYLYDPSKHIIFSDIDDIDDNKVDIPYYKKKKKANNTLPARNNYNIGDVLKLEDQLVKAQKVETICFEAVSNGKLMDLYDNPKIVVKPWVIEIVRDVFSKFSTKDIERLHNMLTDVKNMYFLLNIAAKDRSTLLKQFNDVALDEKEYSDRKLIQMACKICYDIFKTAKKTTYIINTYLVARGD